MELIMTWVIKAEHTGAFPGNPSFAWIKRKFYIFMHRHPAPSELEHSLVGILGSWKGPNYTTSTTDNPLSYWDVMAICCRVLTSVVLKY